MEPKNGRRLKAFMEDSKFIIFLVISLAIVGCKHWSGDNESSVLNFSGEFKDLDQVDWTSLGYHQHEIVYESKSLKIALGNYYCSDEQVEVNAPNLETVFANIIFYKNSFPHVLRKFVALLESSDIQNKEELLERILPFTVVIFIDGNADCINATAFGSSIYLPLQANEEDRRSNFGFLAHEFGHSLESAVVKRDISNIYDEMFADVVSMLIFDQYDGFARVYQSPADILGRYRTELKQRMVLYETHLGSAATRDPQYIFYKNIYDCSSDTYFRDFRRDFSISRLLEDENPYTTSCAILSFFKKLGDQQFRLFLQRFFEGFLQNHQYFFSPDIREVISSLDVGRKAWLDATQFLTVDDNGAFDHEAITAEKSGTDPYIKVKFNFATHDDKTEEEALEEHFRKLGSNQSSPSLLVSIGYSDETSFFKSTLSQGRLELFTAVLQDVQTTDAVCIAEGKRLAVFLTFKNTEGRLTRYRHDLSAPWNREGQCFILVV